MVDFLFAFRKACDDVPGKPESYLLLLPEATIGGGLSFATYIMVPPFLHQQTPFSMSVLQLNIRRPSQAFHRRLPLPGRMRPEVRRPPHPADIPNRSTLMITSFLLYSGDFPKGNNSFSAFSPLPFLLLFFNVVLFPLIRFMRYISGEHIPSVGHLFLNVPSLHNIPGSAK